jgi:hypothetical protein
MRQGVLLFAPVVLAVASVVACGTQARRSGFSTEAPPTEPSYEPNLGLNDMDGGKAEGGCSSSQTMIMRTPVVIEFLVDESTSMNSKGKWEAARDSLRAAFDDMNAQGDSSTFVGLYLFPKNEKIDPDAFTTTGHHDDLDGLINVPKGTGSGTPTKDALNSAYRIVERFKPPTSTGLSIDDLKRVVVLVSDGAPTGGDPVKTECENLVESKATAGKPVMTFSVGIGPFPSDSPETYDPAFMGRLAQRGGTAPAGCNPASTDPSQLCHFQVTPGDDVNATKQALLDAINKIRALTASCEFSFEKNKHTDLSKIDVVVTDKDGNVSSIPKDPDNGWSFDDDSAPSKVILNGTACSSTNGVVSGRVDVVIGCKGAN